MAYGWMPRVVRIDPQHTPSALAALLPAQTATPATMRGTRVADIAACLHSVVGASKVLHFVNDAVFPIWDSNIETFRLGGKPPHNHNARLAALRIGPYPISEVRAIEAAALELARDSTA
jgi:hypothetical protein